MDATELKRLAAEVSAQHGIRIDTDDPIMAVVTLNRLVLETALNSALQSIQIAADGINQAGERVQVRAGSAAAQEVRECTMIIREELRKDIDAASLHARELIQRLNTAQARGPVLRWIVTGVVGGAALFAAGFYSGMLLR